MPVPAITNVPPADIAQVRAFLRVQRDYEAFKTKHAATFRKLGELAVTYNASLAAADAAVRKLRVACGPFDLYSFQPSYDGAAFCEEVGEAKFVALGGEITTVRKMAIAPALFEGLVASKTVTPGTAEKVVTYGPRYHAPKSIVVP
jgi:hypothetical protein